MEDCVYENKTALLHGDSPEKIASKIGGTLKIGESQIHIAPKSSVDVPVLCGGQSGVVQAMFYSDNGTEYELFDVTLKNGVVVPPAGGYEKLARDYKLVMMFTEQIARATQELELMNAQKQEAVRALNGNPLKHLIE